MKNIKNSQVADNNSTIVDSKNEVNISLKKIRTETTIISFIVGFLSSIIASYIYEHFLK